MIDREVLTGSVRRRSVDVGGLALALGNSGHGHGWGGWDEREQGEPKYAELLIDMYEHTNLTANRPYSPCPEVELSDDARRRLIESLDNWNFEPHKLPEEEILASTQILFEVLFRIEGMQQDLGVSLTEISSFLRCLRKEYRTQNSYHNYQHALDVLQATHCYLRAAGLVPPATILLDGDDRLWRPAEGYSARAGVMSCLDNDDIFTLFITAIGHDVGHPGFTNVFMKNAGTPLSMVFDDKSPLERLHHALLIHLMRVHGMEHLLNSHRRKLLLSTVLATDMSVHADFMRDFRALAQGDPVAPCEQKKLVCQAILKCADISNPSRPHMVSQYWASALAEEWTCQAMLERYFQLPATVQSVHTKRSEAASQVWFINAFAKPLLDLTAVAIPAMDSFAEQCTANLDYWYKRSTLLAAEDAAAQKAPPPSRTEPVLTLPSIPTHQPEDFLDAFPLALPLHDLWTPPTPSVSSSDASSSSPASEAGSVRAAYGASGRARRAGQRNSWNAPLLCVFKDSRPAKTLQ